MPNSRILCLGMLVLSIFSNLSLNAQINISGQWDGLLRQHIMGSFTDSPYQLNIEQVGDSIYGIAHIEASEFLSVYAKMSFTGTISGTQISIKEKKFLEGTNLDNAIGWCIKNLKLTYVKSKKGYRLKGKWSGYASNNGKPCKPGILFLDKLSAHFNGYVQDSTTSEMISSKVFVYNLSNNEKTAALQTYKSEGHFNFYADTAHLYQILVKAKGYHNKVIRLKAKNEGATDTLLLHPLQNGDLLEFGDIQFIQSTAYLVKDSEIILERLYTFLEDNNSIKIEVSGHTSNEGDPKKNKELSLNRAETIAKFLIQKGILKGRINTLGYGSEKPIASNNTLEGKKRNRRVEFRVISE